ncbi:MAG: glucose 1-dehydrogenase [Myxococcales bacterium]|nr:glucose 1-dehydrogenase [Myxococcales bacterium]
MSSMADSISLQDKVAIVTGGSRGIGEAIARAMARAGARVVVASRKIDGCERVVSEIEQAGGEALAVACHTGKPEQIEALMKTVLDRFGKVDVLVNNAATNPYFGPMIQLAWAAWDKTFEVNVKGYFEMARVVARHLIERGAPGAIVNLASVLGQDAAPMQGIYGMTKAAVISMTKTLSVELGGANIRVNAIAPGLIETRFSQAMTSNKQILDMVLERTSLKRVGKPDDVAQAAVLLASDAASYITGETLVIDGGWTAS